MADDKEQAPPALNVGSIEDLERRMAAMGSPQKKSPPPPSFPQNSAPPPAAAPVMAKTRANVGDPPAMGGKKNPLLARIMAAKEKQQRESGQLPPAAVPPPSTDLLSMDLPPPATENLPPPALPPPSYETNFSNDMPPPPAFDMVEQKLPPQETEFLPPPPMDDLLPPPPPLNNVLPPPVDLLGMNMPFIPDATAPSFEDLHHMQQQHQPPPAPPPTPQIDESILEALDPAERQAFLEEQRKILEQIESEKSQNEAPAELQIDESILEALDPAERQGFLEEQRKILKQIEKSKPGSSTAAKARAFDQRSSAAVADMAAQMESDAEMAARLQREENERTPQRRNRGRGAARESQSNLSDAELAAKLQREENAKQRSRNREQSTSSSGQSWYEWLTGTGTPATNTASSSSPNSIVSRSSPPPARRGLVAAVADESVGLLGSSNSGEAPSESMFSRVASSMKTQMYSLQSDEDGNVHGVDSQGLLAMPNVSRQREN